MDPSFKDISFYSCIELTGRSDSILSSLSAFTRAEVDAGFSFPGALSAAVKGETILYHPGVEYPGGVIGEVRIVCFIRVVRKTCCK